MRGARMMFSAHDALCNCRIESRLFSATIGPPCASVIRRGAYRNQTPESGGAEKNRRRVTQSSQTGRLQPSRIDMEPGQIGLRLQSSVALE
jgi:hypothetical protein